MKVACTVLNGESGSNAADLHNNWKQPKKMTDYPQLLVYKASAGSGKTFTLAVQYIKQLIEDTHAYRRILAVTFTNKATAEMKKRILEQLFGLANGLKSLL